ncbi:phosphatase 2C-domain-containing protein [Haematococcus lacustris]
MGSCGWQGDGLRGLAACRMEDRISVSHPICSDPASIPATRHHMFAVFDGHGGDAQQQGLRLHDPTAATGLALLPPPARRQQEERREDQEGRRQQQGQPPWQQSWRSAGWGGVGTGEGEGGSSGVESGEVVVLSQLHEAEQEAEAGRLKTAGGWVEASTPGAKPRLLGELELSRAFGDAAYRAVGLTAEPHLSQLYTLGPHSELLILASDGLFETGMSEEEVCEHASAVTAGRPLPATLPRSQAIALAPGPPSATGVVASPVQISLASSRALVRPRASQDRYCTPQEAAPAGSGVSDAPECDLGRDSSPLSDIAGECDVVGDDGDWACQQQELAAAAEALAACSCHEDGRSPSPSPSPNANPNLPGSAGNGLVNGEGEAGGGKAEEEGEEEEQPTSPLLPPPPHTYPAPAGPPSTLSWKLGAVSDQAPAHPPSDPAHTLAPHTDRAGHETAAAAPPPAGAPLAGQLAGAAWQGDGLGRRGQQRGGGLGPSLPTPVLSRPGHSCLTRLASLLQGRGHHPTRQGTLPSGPPVCPGALWRGCASTSERREQVVMKRVFAERGQGPWRSGVRELHFGRLLEPHQRRARRGRAAAQAPEAPGSLGFLHLAQLIEGFQTSGKRMDPGMEQASTAHGPPSAKDLWLVFQDAGVSLHDLMYEPLDAAAQQQGGDRGGVENAGVDDAEHRVRGAREPAGDGNAGRGSALLITPGHTDLVTSSAGLAAEDEDHRDVKQQAAQEREAKSSVGQQQLPEGEDDEEQSAGTQPLTLNVTHRDIKPENLMLMPVRTPLQQQGPQQGQEEQQHAEQADQAAPGQAGPSQRARSAGRGREQLSAGSQFQPHCALHLTIIDMGSAVLGSHGHEVRRGGQTPGPCSTFH